MMSRLQAFNSLLFLGLCSLQSLTGFAQNCEPTLSMPSLLNSVRVDGSLYIGKIYARCLPMPAKKSRTAYEYNPYDGGKFSTTLKNAGGQAINTYVWYGDQILSLWELNRFEVVGGPEAVKKLAPGNYSIDFAVEDKVFRTFPFSLSTKQSADQFRPETLYLLEGAWRDYAELYAPNLDRFIKLTVWLRDVNNLGGPKPPPVPVRVRLIREKDKQLLAETDEGYRYSLTHRWQSFDLAFRKPNAKVTKDYSEFKLSEVTAIDGRYKFEMTVDDKPYLDYSFTVKNGKLNDIDLVQMRKEEYKIIVPLTATRRD